MAHTRQSQKLILPVLNQAGGACSAVVVGMTSAGGCVQLAGSTTGQAAASPTWVFVCPQAKPLRSPEKEASSMGLGEAAPPLPTLLAGSRKVAPSLTARVQVKIINSVGTCL